MSNYLIMKTQSTKESRLSSQLAHYKLALQKEKAKTKSLEKKLSTSQKKCQELKDMDQRESKKTYHLPRNL